MSVFALVGGWISVLLSFIPVAFPVTHRRPASLMGGALTARYEMPLATPNWVDDRELESNISVALICAAHF
jgi:hypothetical protein